MESFGTIRDALPVSGKAVVDVTCDDWEEICREYPNPEDREVTKVYVHFDDGSTLTFHCSENVGFLYDGHPE